MWFALQIYAVVRMFIKRSPSPPSLLTPPPPSPSHPMAQGAPSPFPSLLDIVARVPAACKGKSHVTRHTSHVTHHTSHVTRHTSHVTRHTSRHTSHVTRHTSHVTRHTSHVTRHTSHVTRHTQPTTTPAASPSNSAPQSPAQTKQHAPSPSTPTLFLPAAHIIFHTYFLKRHTRYYPLLSLTSHTLHRN